MSVLRVMSYNVLHFENVRTGEIDYDAFAAVVREKNADIVGLNEVYGGAAKRGEQAAELAKRLGWHWTFSEAFLDDGTEPFGNAVVSRFPIDRAETIPIPYPEVRNGTEYYEPRAVLRAQIAGHTVLVTHFGLNPDEQENALQTVLPLLGSRRCILMGDFNVTPDAPVLSPIRARMRDVDAFLPAGTKSFPSDEPRKKIDFIFTSPDYTVTAADVPAVVVSDHRPYIAELTGDF
jgi:endonuclease/exonuclease/phosphatase family metal-dependent hydrolase